MLEFAVECLLKFALLGMVLSFFCAAWAFPSFLIWEAIKRWRHDDAA